MSLSISEQLTYSTVRIECSLTNGSVSTGTGFFFNFDEKPDGSHIPVIITNKHVIEKSTTGKFVITKADSEGNPTDREFLPIELNDFEKRWVPHPDPQVDLCAMPIAPIIQLAEQQNYKLAYRSLTRKLLPTEEQRLELDAIEDVLMIGYPNGIWDKVNNKPIVRKGITATHPNLDYNGKKEILIDIAAFPGSSGSPVLICNQGSYRSKNGDIFMGSNRIMLLGVLFAGPQSTTIGEIMVVPSSQKPIAVSSIPNNLGYIIKSERILELEEIFKARHTL